MAYTEARVHFTYKTIKTVCGSHHIKRVGLLTTTELDQVTCANCKKKLFLYSTGSIEIHKRKEKK